MTRPPRALVFTAAIAVALGVGAFFGARHVATSSARAPASAPPSGELELRVPRAAGPILLDGDTDDPGWAKGAARIPALFAGGAPARPHSEARVVWGDGHLYLALYAADEDVRATATAPDAPLWLEDSFQLAFRRGSTTYAIDVSPLGTVTDAVRIGGGAPDYSWDSGAHVSRELDGTINDSRDDDEEWVIEMAIPFESLGLRGERGERIGFSLRRCDTLKNRTRVCASWGEGEGTIVLE